MRPAGELFETLAGMERQGLSRLVREIRDWVNEPENRARLKKVPRGFDQICSAMDAIEDCDHALSFHTTGLDRIATTLNDRTGLLYLSHYGFLQALFLQQDAVDHLAGQLGAGKLDLAGYPQLREVRDVRNSVAHMTQKGHKEETREFYGIIQGTMTPSTFDLYRFDSQAEFETVPVSTRELLLVQERALGGELARILRHLEASADWKAPSQP